jgi:sodium/bile acid cotransporter 7
MRLGPVRVDGFLVAIALAVVAAALDPALGATGSPLRLDRLVLLSVSLVFFLHGAQLPSESLVRGARNWRLHLVVQGTTFVVLPLAGLAVWLATRGWLPPGLALGAFYVGVVSSTISSAIAYTALAGGNVPAAVFNATLSGILGVLLTPTLTGLVATTAGVHVPVLDAIASVVTRLLLPLLAGQLLRPLLAGFLGRHRQATAIVDRGAIVAIVYLAFCDSILAGVWANTAWWSLAGTLVLAGALFAFGTWVPGALARRLGFDRADTITAVFCGSQKSLANGMPIANVLFGGNPALGLIVLPMLVYHQLQLVYGAVLARRWASGALP